MRSDTRLSGKEGRSKREGSCDGNEARALRRPCTCGHAGKSRALAGADERESSVEKGSLPDMEGGLLLSEEENCLFVSAT